MSKLQLNKETLEKLSVGDSKNVQGAGFWSWLIGCPVVIKEVSFSEPPNCYRC